MRKPYFLLVLLVSLLLAFSSCTPDVETKTYTITFIANGADEGNVPNEITVIDGNSVEIPSCGTLKKKGYDFVSWNTKADGTGIDYNLSQEESTTRNSLSNGSRTTSNATITPKDNLILYAKWKIHTYHISYSLDGGVLANGFSNPTEYTIETNTFRLINPSKDNSTFKFWKDLSTNITSKDISIEKGSIGDRIFQAVWEESSKAEIEIVPTTPTYTVKFDTNGGSPTIDEQIIEEGHCATEPNDIQKEGLTFIYWSLNNQKFSFDTPINQDITLEAQWGHVVSFDTDGGTTMDSEKVFEGESLFIENNPTKEGAELIGWTLDGIDYDFFTIVTKDITLKAKWATSDEDVYKVVVNYNDDTPNREYKVVKGESYTLPNAPSKEKFVFKAWEVDSVEYKANDAIVISEDTTINAVWTPIYTITVDTGTTIYTEEYLGDMEYTLPEAAEKSGYTFKAWLIDSAEYAPGTNIPVTGNINIKATWNEFTVVFDSVGGTPVENQIIPVGGKATKPNTPTKEGYYLYNWITNRNDNEFDFDTVITKDITLRANWVENGKYPVLTQLSETSFKIIRKVHQIYYSDEGWDEIICTVNLTQKNNLFEVKPAGSNLTNGTFCMTATGSSFIHPEIEGKTVRVTSDSTMIDDSGIIVLTIRYKDYYGKEETIYRTLTITKETYYY